MKRTAFALLAAASVSLGCWGSDAGSPDSAPDTRLADPWRSLPPMPTARLDATAAVVDGTVYVIGGATKGLLESPLVYVTAVEAYDVASSTWSSRAPLPAPIGHAASAAANGTIYVFAGQVLAYDPGADAWSPRSAYVPAYAACAVGGILYVADYATRSLRVYDPASDTATSRAPIPDGIDLSPSGSMVPAVMAPVGGRIDLVGWNAVLSYDPAVDQWTPHTAPPTGVTFWSGGSAGSLIFVLRDDPYLAQASSYDTVADTWRTGRSTLSEGDTYGAAVATVGEEIVFFGGYEGHRGLNAHVRAYDPAAE